MRALVAPVTAALIFAGCSSASDPGNAHSPAPQEQRAARSWTVKVVATNLDHPWDIAPIDDNRFLFTERSKKTLRLWADGNVTRMKFPSKRVWSSGETGLMGVVVDPDFTVGSAAGNRRIYVCTGWKQNGRRDIRVISWRINLSTGKLDKRRTLVTGIPTTTGRHGGCRLLIADNGALLVGTGDAADERNPRDLTRLGGKVLRLDRHTGKAWPSNKWATAKNRNKRYVFTLGHRNVQGLAQRSDGSLWSIEQGTDRDDEVNRLRKGGDYGYQPGPGYDESVPMTDQSLPGRQIDAAWSSGKPTLATSGGTFVPRGFGSYSGTLAVAALKASRVVFMTFNAAGKLTKTRTPAALRHYGRLRTVVADRNTLLIATDNGGGQDKILRVTFD